MEELDNLRGLVDEKTKEISALEDMIIDLKEDIGVLESKLEDARDLGYLIMRKGEEIYEL
jgi:predicted  nucleic acid-binding Zn-ribbon protein